MSHHPLCMTLWSGEADHCECPDANTCRACPDTCKECTWQNETCECYIHEYGDQGAPAMTRTNPDPPYPPHPPVPPEPLTAPCGY